MAHAPPRRATIAIAVSMGRRTIPRPSVDPAEAGRGRRARWPSSRVGRGSATRNSSLANGSHIVRRRQSALRESGTRGGARASRARKMRCVAKQRAIGDHHRGDKSDAKNARRQPSLLRAHVRPARLVGDQVGRVAAFIGCRTPARGRRSGRDTAPARRRAGADPQGEGEPADRQRPRRRPSRRTDRPARAGRDDPVDVEVVRRPQARAPWLGDPPGPPLDPVGEQHQEGEPEVAEDDEEADRARKRPASASRTTRPRSGRSAIQESVNCQYEV